MPLLSVFLVLLFVVGLVSRRLERTVFTTPMLFVVAGLIASLWRDPIGDPHRGLEVLLNLAEIGLSLLLFTDASRTDLRLLRRIGSLPTRLLSVGLLLTILLGAILAKLVFPQLSLWQVGILAAILAPTDAGLGQVIVSSPLVPARIRQALNVEAGLNDGLAVPFLLFFMGAAGLGAGWGAESTASAVTGDAVAVDQSSRFLQYVLEQLGYGTLLGLGIGLVGGQLLAWARRAEWMSGHFGRLCVVVLPLLCVVTSDVLGASMFIAAFVAGLAVQIRYPHAGGHSVEFAEEWGQLFNLAVFFLFGLLVADAWRGFDLRMALYAGLSLTVVRLLPVALALAGTGLSRPSILFIGWFGPRGLASIVLSLLYLEQLWATTEHPVRGGDTIVLTVMATVLGSVMLHGLTAAPGISWYVRAIGRLPQDAPEREPDVPPEAAANAGVGIRQTTAS